MAYIEVTNATEARAALGYWDDSGAVRVAGTAVAGDRVHFDTTGTIDLGSDDNILYPPAGVWISGPGKGSLTVQGRLYISGTGATNVVSRISRIKLDSKGYGALPAAINGATTVFGTMQVENVNFVAELADFSNSDPTSGDANTITFYNQGVANAVTVILDRCTGTGAYLDLVSTKGTQSGATLYAFKCEFSTPGTGLSDQALTGHDGWKNVLVEGTYNGNQSGQNVAVAGPGSDSTVVELYNVQTNGSVLFATKAKGCKISQGSLTGELEECHYNSITGYDNATWASYQFAGLRVESVAGNADIHHAYIEPAAARQGIQDGLLIENATKTVAISDLVTKGTQDAIDARAASATITIDDSLLDCTRYGIMGNAADDPAANNVVSGNATASTSGWFTTVPATAGTGNDGNATITQTDIDTETAWLADLDLPQRQRPTAVFTVPDIEAAKDTLLTAGGWDVTRLYSPGNWWHR